MEEPDGHLLATGYALNAGHRYGLLSPADVQAAVAEARRRHPAPPALTFIEALLHPNARPSQVNFHEATIAEVAASGAAGRPLPRRAEVVSQALAANQTFVDIVVLDAAPETVANAATAVAGCTSTTLQDVQPGFSPDECALVERLCRAYGPLQDAVRARGLDPAHIACDAWCVGYTGPADEPTERLSWPTLHYYAPHPLAAAAAPGNGDPGGCGGCGGGGGGGGGGGALPYACPLEGIHMRVSLTHRRVVAFQDVGLGRYPVPKAKDDPASKYPLHTQLRTDLTPIVVTQPLGPSFSVSGDNAVRWSDWRFSVGFNTREGAVLHGLCLHGRPVLHRVCFSEMVVPYGDPAPPVKCAFDAGEDGFGKNANSLKINCDCLGHIHYFDAHLVRDGGECVTIAQAVCMHEEDVGLAWKHTDWRTGQGEVRRARKLVVQFICTVANYDYAFSFDLFLDGTIALNVKLTGVLSTGVLSHADAAAGGRKYGSAVGGDLYAPVHQHFFVARIDAAVDGSATRVVECNARADDEGPHNPTLNGFFFESTVLATELAAVRDCAPERARYWKIESAHARNALGHRTAYKIVPGPTITPFAPLARAAHLRRASFLAHQLWVTPFAEDENYPGGDWPNQNPSIDGLTKWTQLDRSLVDRSLVVWHIFGLTHMPRPEDWPVMPVETCGFALKPCGFFASSPVMDLPLGNGHWGAAAGGAHGSVQTRSNCGGCT